MSALWTVRWTAALTALALVIALHEPLAAALAFERAVEWSEPWRIVTGHLAHWSTDHALWDIATFAALGAVAERRGRGRFLGCVGATALLVTAGVALLQPELTAYRGLSGIDSALFVLVFGLLWRDARCERDAKHAAVLAVALAAFALKVAWEAMTGATVFTSAAQFTPVPLAHAIGGVVGGLGALWPHHGQRPSVRYRPLDKSAPSGPAVGPDTTCSTAVTPVSTESAGIGNPPVQVGPVATKDASTAKLVGSK